MSLKEVGEAVSRARSCIQRWFDLYRNNGVERLLCKEHAGGIESTLNGSVAQARERSAGNPCGDLGLGGLPS